MNLIYTFNSRFAVDPYKKDKLVSFYTNSIASAKNLNYKVELYSDINWFDDLVDVKHSVNYYHSPLWDSFKFIPLQYRFDKFILTDGDVLFTNPIEINLNCDFAFDTYEQKNWSLLYKETVLTLANLGVKNYIPEWSTIPVNVMSCGLLYFNDLDFRLLYARKWRILNYFIYKNRKALDLYSCTAVAAQFLLTLLARHYNKQSYYYSSELGTPNTYYTHYAGSAKYKNKNQLEYSLI